MIHWVYVWSLCILYNSVLGKFSFYNIRGRKDPNEPFLIRHSHLSLSTGCFDTLDPPPQSILALVHVKSVCFHDPTSIPDDHVPWLMCQSRAHFHEQFLADFFGWLSKKWPQNRQLI